MPFPQVSSISAVYSSFLCFNDVRTGLFCMPDSSGWDPGSSVVLLHEDVFSTVDPRQVVCVAVVVELLGFLSILQRLSYPYRLVWSLWADEWQVGSDLSRVQNLSW